MPEAAYKYIWRCARCSSHFANVYKTEGIIKQEKKCPKCKSLNTLTLSAKEIYIHCLFYDPQKNSFQEEIDRTYLEAEEM